MSAGADRGDWAARLHLRLSLGFLALGSVLFALVLFHAAGPDLFRGSDWPGFLSYGRLFPAAFNLIVYGWLTVGLLGAGYYILPRVSGKQLRGEGWAGVGAVLLTVGILGGAVGVVLGENEGRQYLEFPWWSDVVVLLGLLIVVRTFIATIAQEEGEPLAPAEWFFGSAPVWLLLAHIVGNIPGLVGVNSVVQTTFYRGALFGMWLAAAGVGVLYYLVSEVTGRDPRRVTQLSVAGFWSLAFVFALSSGSRLTYTAAPDWLETIGGIFSIALFLPVAIILVDVAVALRGTVTPYGGSAARFLVAGCAAFAVYPVANVALSMRSSNAVLGMTDWVWALDLLAVLGAFGFWMLALHHHVSLLPGRGKAHHAFSTVAVLAVVGSMLVSGLQAGLTWVAAANSGKVSAGEAFESTAAALPGHLWVRFAGAAVFALSQLWLLFAAFRLHDMPVSDAGESENAGIDDTDEAMAPIEESDDLGGLPAGVAVSLGRLRTATIGVFAFVALFAFALPALEADHVDGTLLADEVRDYGSSDDGRALYLAEGCWYCHTQEVRGIVTDVGLGPVAQPGDYANETPSSAGVVRTGPDLMFAGSREGITADWVAEFLKDPRAIRSWSTMPSYGHLSASDRAAVAEYVAGLETFEFE